MSDSKMRGDREPLPEQDSSDGERADLTIESDDLPVGDDPGSHESASARVGRGRRHRPSAQPEQSSVPEVDGNVRRDGDIGPPHFGPMEQEADKPLWQQFGVPPSYWERDSGRRRGSGPRAAGQSGRGVEAPRGGRRRDGAGATTAPGRRGRGAGDSIRSGRVIGCRTCGVKIERRRAHGRGRVACPMCGKWMQ